MNIMAVDLVIGYFRLEVGLDNVWAITCTALFAVSGALTCYPAISSRAVPPRASDHHHTSKPLFSIPWLADKQR